VAATFAGKPIVHDETAGQDTGAVSSGIGQPALDAVDDSTIADERIGGLAYNLTVHNPA
jgi:hypothetical protein